MERFLGQFCFKPELAGWVGVERERFLWNGRRPVPEAASFLAQIADPAWTHELSACQVEDRTAPHRDLYEIRLNLLQNNNLGNSVAWSLGRHLVACEVAPADMLLDTWSDPRYDRIVQTMSQEKLLAACRVAGTHIHLGTRCIEEAIVVHNALATNLERLSRLGDHSRGERLRLYQVVAEHSQPPQYENQDHLFQVAKQEGFDSESRNCWHLVRITHHGTVECRMFGTTLYPDEILDWISAVRLIARQEGGLR